MELSFITPIQKWDFPAGVSNDTEKQKTQNTSLFQSVFENAIQDVKDSENNLQYQQYLLATGQIEDPHTVQIAASQAQLTTNMLVYLRNKAMDSYNELMRISL